MLLRKNTKTGEVDNYILRDTEYTNQARESALRKRNIYIKEEITNSKTKKSTLDHVIEMAKKNADFYYENKKISPNKAIQLIKENSSLTVSSSQKDDNNPRVTFYKKGSKHLETLIPPKPPVPAKSAYEYVKNLKNKKNISYFYNNKSVSYKEALKITKNEPKININSHIDNGVGTVRFQSIKN